MNVFSIQNKDIDTGFYIKNLNTGKVFKHNENHLFPLASVAKMVASVIVCKFHEDIPMETIEQAIAEHSNRKYHSLLEIKNEAFINNYLCNQKFDLFISRDNRDVINNCGTPQSIAILLENVLSKGFLTDSCSAMIYTALKKQMDQDGFRLEKKGTWAHMTGGLDQLCVDVGILDKKIIMVGFARSLKRDVEWNRLERILTDTGQSILNGPFLK